MMIWFFLMFTCLAYTQWLQSVWCLFNFETNFNLIVYFIHQGKNSGVEKRIRDNKCHSLLDIDGESCHKMHGVAKKFCDTFKNILEKLFKYLFLDFRWSRDQLQYFEEVSVLHWSHIFVNVYVLVDWFHIFFTNFYTLFLLLSNEGHWL